MTQINSDYDNNDFFKALLASLAPLGFEDISYGNDTCPSIGREFEGDGLLQCFVEYKDKNLREVDDQDVVIATYSVGGDFVHSMSLQDFNLQKSVFLCTKMISYIEEGSYNETI
tara:strand:+ start:101 stop:442 length:342 start_codon:yes stop_codon:yes gene_type:complete